jgi:hypothetical protein
MVLRGTWSAAQGYTIPALHRGTGPLADRAVMVVTTPGVGTIPGIDPVIGIPDPCRR